MAFRSDDDVQPDFPSRDEIEAVADLETPLPVRDLSRADWSDTTGDHRWRSLDPTWMPGKPRKGWEP